MYSTPDSDRFHTSPPEFFASRTKVYLDIELESPSIATAQATVVLSCFECAAGQDSRGILRPLPLAVVVNG
jgi:hypothetical protein